MADANPKSPNRRQPSKRMVDATFQVRFLLRLSAILLSCMAFFMALTIFAPFAFSYLVGYPRHGLETLLERLDILVLVVLPAMAATFLCLLGQGVRETFKVAGPNIRFRSVFDELRSRRIPRGVRIRKGDYLQETAHSLDSALLALHTEVSELHELARRTQQALAEHPCAEPVTRAVADLAQRLLNIELENELPGPPRAPQQDSSSSVEPRAPRGVLLPLS